MINWLKNKMIQFSFGRDFLYEYFGLTSFYNGTKWMFFLDIKSMDSVTWANYDYYLCTSCKKKFHISKTFLFISKCPPSIFSSTDIVYQCKKCKSFCVITLSGIGKLVESNIKIE
jgi:hypothetical protein